MNLGAFSISLNVQDIAASLAFYQKLGFTIFQGDVESKCVILKNGDTVVGIFQGMIDKNALTFNPGWNQNAEETPDFTDVRELQRQLRAEGIEFDLEAIETTSGPGYFIIHDPDGNPILVDQHR